MGGCFHAGVRPVKRDKPAILVALDEAVRSPWCHRVHHCALPGTQHKAPSDGHTWVSVRACGWEGRGEWRKKRVRGGKEGEGVGEERGRRE